ncbi:MAG: ECF transporter S component [Candidatus Coatesbacteria bacterium]|nr:ECF transporter S component [Candidatus Coatesbacteria bacterium]
MEMSTLAESYLGRGLVQPHVKPIAQSLLITSFIVGSVAIPFAAHQFGAEVGRVLSPMHFFALLAGVVLGWRAGLLVGAASPLVSYMLSGMPTGLSLPILVAEIGAYGLVAGLLQARGKNLWPSLIAALVAGRIVLFAAAALLLPTPLLAYMGAVTVATIPGLVLQLVLIPPAAKLLCSWLDRRANG